MVRSIGQSVTAERSGVLYIYRFPVDGILDTLTSVHVTEAVTGSGALATLFGENGKPAPTSEALLPDGVPKVGKVAYKGRTSAYSNDVESGMFDGPFVFAERPLNAQQQADFVLTCRNWLLSLPQPR